MLWELADVVGHSDEQACTFKMLLPLLHKNLDENVAMDDHEILVHFHGDTDVLLLQVSVHVEQHVMRHTVVAVVLLTACDDDGRARGIAVAAQGHVELEQVLGVLWHAVGVSHEELIQLVGEGLVVGLAHRLNRHVNASAVGQGTQHKVAQSLVVLLRKQIEATRVEVVLLLLKVQRNARVVISASCTPYKPSVVLHLIVLAGKLEGLIQTLSHDEELEGGRHIALLLEPLGNQPCTVCRLRLLHQCNCCLRVVQVLKLYAYHVVKVPSSGVSLDCLLVLALSLPCLGIRKVQLGRRDQAEKLPDLCVCVCVCVCVRCVR
eukprot:Colp12_sorted_trinity150504_noHs@29732